MGYEELGLRISLSQFDSTVFRLLLETMATPQIRGGGSYSSRAFISSLMSESPRLQPVIHRDIYLVDWHLLAKQTSHILYHLFRRLDELSWFFSFPNYRVSIALNL